MQRNVAPFRDCLLIFSLVGILAAPLLGFPTYS
jgi:hypothetical protein